MATYGKGYTSYRTKGTFVPEMDPARVAKVMGDRLLIKRLPEPGAEERTVGGIIRPAAAKPRSRRAVVVAVGTDMPKEQGDLVPGAVIMTSAYDGMAPKRFSWQDEPYEIILAEDVLALLEPVPAEQQEAVNV